MSEKTPPPVQSDKGSGAARRDGSAAARGIKTGPPIDPASETLHGFDPVASGSSPPSGPVAETNTEASAATLKPGSATMVPHDPAAKLAVRPVNLDQTIAAVSGPADQTLAGNPAATLGGGLDAATREFHKAALAAAPKVVATGQSFGQYELLEPIAKGGMGIVYKARQKTLNRIVAIKMILAGQFADQSDIDRFYAEAEAAAALTHPNIVAIHEIGEINGQHFFSMDFIEGKSLSGLIQENPVPPRRAAELTRTITETMEFAHEKGVVHRDLKPANVLLDKRQRPLITDFGLAKQVSNTSQLTMAGSIVGTPSYMPPEQAAGKIEEVGPWSDLYSIGAILYELLTGRPPFRAASPFETIRQVLETEPPSPRLLNPNVPKDLETICLKCLQKERARRYGSCHELSEELGRYLRGEPIQARPISQVARLWRLCKRYPIAASSIALTVVALISASVVSTAFSIQASRALVKSNESLKEAIDAVNESFTTISEDALINEAGMQPLREKLLAKTKTYFERFAEQRAGDPTVEVELAGAYFRLGEIAAMLQSPDDAIKPYERARGMQERIVARRPKELPALKALGDTINAIGRVYTTQRDFLAARREFDTAVEIRERLIAGDPENAEYKRGLANTHMNIGNIAQFNGQFADARTEFEEAQQIRTKALQHVTAGDPAAKKIRRDFGMTLFNLGNLDLFEAAESAEEHFKESAKTFEELIAADSENLEFKKQLALIYRRIGNVLTNNGRLDEARQYYNRALERAEPLAQQNPKVAEYALEWAGILTSLFDVEQRAGNQTEAAKWLEKARDIRYSLVAKFPTVPRCQEDLATTLRELASLQFDVGEDKQARENLDEALRIAQDLVKQYGQETFHLLEATVLRLLATIDSSQGDSDAAIDHLIQAKAAMALLNTRFPGEQNQFDLALTCRELATEEHRQGDERAAEEDAAESVRLLTELVEKFPDDAEFVGELKKTRALSWVNTPEAK